MTKLRAGGGIGIHATLKMLCPKGLRVRVPPRAPEFMKLTHKNYFVYGQLALGLSLLMCLIIIPKYFFSLDQGGVSNYGTDDRTRTFFTIGFGLATLGSLLAARFLPLKISKRLFSRVMLIILATGYLAVLLTTYSYKVNDFYRVLHERTAIGLFVFMLIFALWLRFFVARQNQGVKRWFWLFGAGIVLAGLTILGIIHLLFTAQILSGVAFAFILNNYLKI